VILSGKRLRRGWECALLAALTQEQYRRVEALLDEALALFAQPEARFSIVVGQIQHNITRVRAEVANLREQESKVGSTVSLP
jgi:hypothetical protein